MELSSPVDDSDSNVEPEPIPGLNGVPVRWYDADRTEPYTRITPFQERHDTTVEFFYKPITLSALAVGLALLAYVATTQDVLEEGRDKRRVGVYASILSFLMFSMIQFRDGPFIRPHPAFWRAVLGVNLLYELSTRLPPLPGLGLCPGHDADPRSGSGGPSSRRRATRRIARLVGRVSGTHLTCFAVAHTLGWFGKAMILRDYWFCWILSIAFELAEYSLQHQLANFAECWWDHWVLDVLICNWIGTYLGMKVCQYLEVKPYEWRGLRQHRGLRSKARRVLSQFSPHDFTAFKWGTASSFMHYFVVVLLLAVFLAAELNPFYLKTLLWMEPDHPIVIMRLAFVFLCALPAVRELYQYINDPRKAVRMGQHVWLLLATILTEILVIRKWSVGVFTEPFPRGVKWGLGTGAVLLVLYPVVQFGIPSARRYIRKEKKKKQQARARGRGREKGTVNQMMIRSRGLGYCIQLCL
ncbi:phosphatidyl serine synthase-domain-containing protein [Desarmillaria tabescens]|uniref:Phosphatidyl serine synthase-domain-containing protein n=1 Tax=Armillaria tabescens TaxID=1929756 RepID=A0AA39TPM8_ARMTA|nr:phosphatidyl serine synthase-domain-containing protein [Desarmillaria tabescens]KAK0462058.1 phosphatidyl serine synthase-domain-containing protein [Desarmillaria tabescens]